MRKMSEGRRNMFVESLEDRRLRSVTLNPGFPGFFELIGDESDNDITIDVDQLGHTFTLDGQIFTGVQQIAVYGKGGNDLILVAGSPGFNVSASIDGGGGDDIISLNFDGSVAGDEGNDRLYLYDSFQ